MALRYACFASDAGVKRPGAFQVHGPGPHQATYDKYVHLFPDNEAEADTLFDNYLTPVTGLRVTPGVTMECNTTRFGAVGGG
jgi:hypothetical protein